MASLAYIAMNFENDLALLVSAGLFRAAMPANELDAAMERRKRMNLDEVVKAIQSCHL